MNMNLFGFNKRTVILILSILVVISFLVLVLINTSKHYPVSQPPVVTFSPRPQASINPIIPQEPSNGVGSNAEPQLVKKYEQDKENEKKFIAAREKVTELIFTLPYSGRYFTLSYDINVNKFTLTLSQNNQNLGKEEFDQFLSSKNVDKQYMEIITTAK